MPTDPVDVAWPAPLALLLGPEAPHVVAAALGEVGGTLIALRARTVSVQPSGATVVRYDAEVESGGRRVGETLAATTGDRIPAGAAAVAGTVGGEPVEVGIWRWPHDPALPGLAHLAAPGYRDAPARGTGPTDLPPGDPDGLRDLLAAAGVPVEAPRATVRAYRPGRRAVLELTGGGRRVFVKVVPPHAAPALRERHDLLAGHVPTPPVLAATDDGVLVLPALPGRPLRALLDTPARPDGPALDALLDRLPPALAGLPSRRQPGDHLARVPHFAAILGATVPSCRSRLPALTARLAAADPGEHPSEPVHGDLYDSQLLVDGGRVTGLLDIDTAGGGYRIDDWATLLAHLSVLAEHGTLAAGRYGAELLAHAERRWPRTQLRPRIAAAVLGLATGPFRVQQRDWAGHTARRLALADRWLG